MTQTGVGRQQDVSDDHSTLRGGIGAVVDGAERSSRACTGVHGVQVVDKALHRLIGVTVGFALGAVSCHLNQSGCLLFGNLIMAAQALYDRCIEFLCSNLQARTAAGLLLCFLQHLCNRLLFVLPVSR